MPLSLDWDTGKGDIAFPLFEYRDQGEGDIAFPLSQDWERGQG